MSPTDHMRRGLGFLGFTLSFLIFSFVAVTVYSTFFDDGANRVTFTEGTAKGWVRSNGELVIVYTRGYTIHVAGDTTLSRFITCTPKEGLVQQYSSHPLLKRDEVGKYPPIERYITTPLLVPVGTPCNLTSYILWQPEFSFTQKLATVGSIDFIVQDKP
jgi:hypothetical protein